MAESADYLQGYRDGYRDCKIISQPINTGGHTFDVYMRIKAHYEDAVFNLSPDDFQRGYGDGFDKAAEEAGITEEAPGQ